MASDDPTNAMDAILDAALDDLDDDDDHDDHHEEVQINQTTTPVDQALKSSDVQEETSPSVEKKEDHTTTSDFVSKQAEVEPEKPSSSESSTTQKSSADVKKKKKKKSKKQQQQQQKSDDTHDNELQAFEDMMKQMLMQAANSTDNEEEAAMLGSFLQHMQAEVEAEQKKQSSSASPKSTPSSNTTSSSSPPKKKEEMKPKTSSLSPSAAATTTTTTTEGLSATVDDTISKLVEDLGKAAPLNESITNNDDGGGGSNIDGDAFPEQGMFQEMMAEFEKLGGGDAGNGSDDLNPDDLIDGVMQQLLSKELMYEPIQQVCEKFPKWLEEERSNMDNEEYQRRVKQYQCFQELTRTYETEPDNSEKLMMLMQDVQEYGQPPAAIVEGIAPGLQLDEDGLPNLEHMMGTNEECTVM